MSDLALADAPAVVPARIWDVPEVVATLTAAFAWDPAVRQLFPSLAEHKRHFPGFVQAFGGRAFDLGTVDRSADGLAAALWYAPGVAPDEEAVMAQVEATVPAERLPGILAGLEEQGRLHPEAPHWYLPFIGVRPEAQRRGLGAALLAHGLARADRDRLPAYLEATSRASLALYRRHGFEVIGTVARPDYPEIFAMWRPARG